VKNKKWVQIGLAAAMVSSLALAGCGDQTEDSGKEAQTGDKPDATQELNLLIGDEIPSMNISKATDGVSFTVLANVGEGLTRLDQNGKATPAMAEKWDVSADGLTYTFTLRDSKWSNGDPVTAHDFEYSWKRSLDPKTAGDYAFMVAWIKGGNDFLTGKGTADQVGVKAKDDKTLVVTLEKPVPFFVEQMSFPTFYPQNKKIVDQAGDKYASDPDKMVYNGPFKMTQWVHEQSVTLEKNENYWDKDKVKLNKINFQVVKDTTAGLNLYESGQIDRVGLVREHIDTYKGKPEFATQPELTSGYVLFNQRVKALQNKKVRQALSWAIDAEAYADVVYHNGTKGATGLVPFGVPDGQGGQFRDTVGDLLKRKDNESKAKAQLEEGLKEAGEAKFPTIKLLTSDSDVGKKGAEFLKEQWRVKLGVDVEVESVPFKLMLQKAKAKDFDIVITNWGADYNDPMTFLDLWISGSSFNYPNWKNAKYDELIKAAQAEADPKKRMQSLMDAEKVLMDEMPMAPLIFRGKAYLLKPHVKNFRTQVFGPEYELKETYIQGKQ